MMSAKEKLPDTLDPPAVVEPVKEARRAPAPPTNAALLIAGLLPNPYSDWMDE